MRTWVKSVLAVGLAGLSTIACAQTPAPEAPRTPEAPEAPAAAAAQQDTDVARQNSEMAREQAARARTEAQVAREHRAITLAMPGGKKEKVAFLGITTTRVTAALRENLNLQRGIGLVIETVGKDTPAEKAGLQKYDIIQKMDDQLLIFPEQLGVLTRLHKSGDEINLTVMRKGQPQQIKVALGEKEMYVSDDGAPVSGSFFTPGSNVFQWSGEGETLAPINAKLKLLRDKLPNSSANYIFQDNQTTLEVTKKDNSKHLKATDKDGKVLFDGAIDTDEQRKAIPEDVSKKLAKLEERMKSLPDSDDGDVKVRVFEQQQP
jgi:hypothetical protein